MWQVGAQITSEWQAQPGHDESMHWTLHLYKTRQLELSPAEFLGAGNEASHSVIVDVTLKKCCRAKDNCQPCRHWKVWKETPVREDTREGWKEWLWKGANQISFALPWSKPWKSYGREGWGWEKPVASSWTIVLIWAWLYWGWQTPQFK